MLIGGLEVPTNSTKIEPLRNLMILQYVAVKQIIFYDFIDIYMHKKLPRCMKVWDRSAVGINWKIND